MGHRRPGGGARRATIAGRALPRPPRTQHRDPRPAGVARGLRRARDDVSAEELFRRDRSARSGGSRHGASAPARHPAAGDRPPARRARGLDGRTGAPRCLRREHRPHGRGGIGAVVGRKRGDSRLRRRVRRGPKHGASCGGHRLQRRRRDDLLAARGARTRCRCGGGDGGERRSPQDRPRLRDRSGGGRRIPRGRAGGRADAGARGDARRGAGSAARRRGHRSRRSLGEVAVAVQRRDPPGRSLSRRAGAARKETRLMCTRRSADRGSISAFRMP